MRNLHYFNIYRKSVNAENTVGQISWTSATMEDPNFVIVT